MAVFNFTQIDSLIQKKLLFPEISDKQFKLGFMWAWGGMGITELAVANHCTVDAVRKSLHRSRVALELEHMDSLRSTFLLRITCDLYVQLASK